MIDVLVANDLRRRFAYHRPRAKETEDHHKAIRSTMVRAAGEVIAVVPAGREQSLAVTALEEAMMWANAGIARAGSDGASQTSDEASSAAGGGEQ